MSFRIPSVALWLWASPLISVGATPLGAQPGRTPGPADLSRQARSALERDDARLAFDLASAAARAFVSRADHEGAARAAILQGASKARLRDLDAASGHLEAARRAGEAHGHPRIQAEALLELAAVARRRGDFAGEAERLRRAIEIALALPAEDLERDALLARLFVSLGVNEREAGRNDEALELYERALALALSAGGERTRIDALGKRSVALLRIGRYDEALIDAQKAHALALAGAPSRSRASAIFALAQVHAHLWDLERAAELWTDALESYQAAGLDLGVALACRQRMDTWFALGDLDRAAEDGRKALSLLGSSAKGYLPGLWARLAHIEALRGRLRPSRDAEAQAIRSAGASNHPAYVWNELALTALAREDWAEAEGRFTRVTGLAGAQDDREYQWRSLDGLGRVAMARGDPAAAERRFREAVFWIDRLRRDLPHPSQRANLVSGRMAPYERLVLSVHRQSRSPGDEYAREALELFDASRARTLSEILEESADEELERTRNEEDELARRISNHQGAILSSTGAELLRLVDELRKLERDYDELAVRLRRGSAAFEDLASAAPLDVSQMSASLAADEAILSFLVADEGGVAWVLTREDFLSYPIPRRGMLDAETGLLLGLIRAGDASARERSRELHRILLEPALATLGTTTRLILVGSGPLRRLPFALLESSDGRLLVERFSISNVPSVRLLARLRNRRRESADALIAVASSRAIEMDAGFAALYGGGADLASRPLVEAGNEAREVAEAMRSLTPTVLDASDATETSLKELDLGIYRVIHFAAHAAVDEAVPRRSALLLGADDRNDGLLQFREIGRLPLTADLVVVSSCSSYLGRTLRGEGFLSLSRGFLHAGARAVAASLWPVSDRQTRRLMRFFYRGLALGLPPDRALRQAQLDMIAAGGGAGEPRNWAGFVLTGDVSSPLAAPGSSSRSLPYDWLALSLLGLTLAGCGWIAARFASRRRASAR